MISSAFVSLILLSSSLEGTTKINRWIEQAAHPQSDSSIQTIAFQRIIASAEIKSNLDNLATRWDIKVSKQGLSPNQLHELTKKLLSRMPVEEIRRLLIQLQNSDSVIQLMGVKALAGIPPSAPAAELPQELALRLLYNKDYQKALAKSYQQGLQIRSEILAAKKEKDLNAQILQKLVEEVTAVANR